MDETALIYAARKGDLNSFNRLVLAYQDMIYNQAFRMMGEQETAEDAAQDAFIIAFRKLGTYRGGSFKAWLLRIVTNLCYDELRRRKRRPTTPLGTLWTMTMKRLSHRVGFPIPANHRKRLPNGMSYRKHLESCLRELSPEFRTIVTLVDLQGLDYSEAAQVVRRPLGTVKSRLARARLNLRNCLKGFWELLPNSFRLLEESET